MKFNKLDFTKITPPVFQEFPTPRSFYWFFDVDVTNIDDSYIGQMVHPGDLEPWESQRQEPNGTGVKLVCNCGKFETSFYLNDSLPSRFTEAKSNRLSLYCECGEEIHYLENSGYTYFDKKSFIEVKSDNKVTLVETKTAFRVFPLATKRLFRSEYNKNETYYKYVIRPEIVETVEIDGKQYKARYRQTAFNKEIYYKKITYRQDKNRFYFYTSSKVGGKQLGKNRNGWVNGLDCIDEFVNLDRFYEWIFELRYDFSIDVKIIKDTIPNRYTSDALKDLWKIFQFSKLEKWQTLFVYQVYCDTHGGYLINPLQERVYKSIVDSIKYNLNKYSFNKILDNLGIPASGFFRKPIYQKNSYFYIRKLLILKPISLSFQNMDGMYDKREYKFSPDILRKITQSCPDNLPSFANFANQSTTNWIKYLLQKILLNPEKAINSYKDEINSQAERALESGHIDKQMYERIMIDTDEMTLGIYLSRYLNDTNNMLRDIMELEARPMIHKDSVSKLHRLHDSLQMEKKKSKVLLENVPNPNKFSCVAEMSNVEYLIQKPRTTHDIIDVGQCMSHCVGTYTDTIMRGDCEIVVIYDSHNFPLVCMEISRNELVQAKLTKNHPVHLAPKLQEIVLSFAKAYEININCPYDIKNNKVTSTAEKVKITTK